MKSSLLKHLRISEAGRDAYDELAHLHYRGDSLGPVRKIFAIRDLHPRRNSFCPVVGVIVYGSPAANLGIRNVATRGMFTGLNRSAGLSMLNSQLLTIRRVIIEPRYRGLGLAGALVKKTMPLTGANMVEAIAAMGLAHPFFVKAGMQEFIPAADAKTERMRAAFETVGIDQRLYMDSMAVHAAVEQLDKSRYAFIKSEMDRFLQKFTSQRNKEHSPARTEFVLSKLDCRVRYYLWINPAKQNFNRRSYGTIKRI